MTITEHTGDSSDSEVPSLDEARARKQSRELDDQSTHTPVDSGPPADDGGYTMGLADDYLSAIDDADSLETEEPVACVSSGDGADYSSAVGSGLEIDESDDELTVGSEQRKTPDEVIAAFSEPHANRQPQVGGGVPRGSADLSPDAAKNRRRNSDSAHRTGKPSPRLRPKPRGPRRSSESDASTRPRRRRLLACVAVLIVVGVVGLAVASFPGTGGTGPQTRAGKTSASRSVTSNMTARTLQHKTAKTVSAPPARAQTKHKPTRRKHAPAARHKSVPQKATSSPTLDQPTTTTPTVGTQVTKTTPAAQTTHVTSTPKSSSSKDQCPGVSSPDSGCLP